MKEPHRSEGDRVDLKKTYGERINSMAYAWAQVNMPEQTGGVLSIGSDDAVKIWLNGKLIHQRWGGPATADSDQVDVVFQKGANQLAFKHLNGIFDWKFSCKFLEVAASN